MRCLHLVLILVTLGAPIAARAGGDVCLFDGANGRVFVFTKLRIPKAPGSAAPASGLMFDGVSTAGVTVGGTVARQTLGRLIFGLTQVVLPCQLYINTDDTLSGSVYYDCNLDGVYETNSSVEAGDCRQVF